MGINRAPSPIFFPIFFFGSSVLWAIRMLDDSKKTLLVTAFLFLLFGTGYVAWSQPPEEKQIEPLAIETDVGKVPQTPEALLLAIKGLIANKDKPGESLCAELLGIPKEIWVDNVITPGSEDKRYVPRSSMFPPAPFNFSSALIGHRGTLIKLELSFYNNQNFRLTPEVVQKIFGYPTILYVRKPTSENSRGVYGVKYRYDHSNDQNSYYMDIVFANSDELNAESRVNFMQHSADIIKYERNRRKEFNVHSHYSPSILELNL